ILPTVPLPCTAEFEKLGATAATLTGRPQGIRLKPLRLPRRTNAKSAAELTQSPALAELSVLPEPETCCCACAGGIKTLRQSITARIVSLLSFMYQSSYRSWAAGTSPLRGNAIGRDTNH